MLDNELNTPEDKICLNCEWGIENGARDKYWCSCLKQKRGDVDPCDSCEHFLILKKIFAIIMKLKIFLIDIGVTHMPLNRYSILWGGLIHSIKKGSKRRRNVPHMAIQKLERSD